MQQSLGVVREQMMDHVVLHQQACDILGVLSEPFRAVHGTLRNSELQCQNGGFTITSSGDLGSVFQEICQLVQSTTAYSNTTSYDVINDQMVDSVKCGRKAKGLVT